MVKITCDNCGKVRPEEARLSQHWQLGYDLELDARNMVQRSIRFLDRWDDRRILELGAIHVCSTACRDEYISKSRAA